MKRLWYHCSSKWHGQRWVAERRCPRIGLDEPRTPRLCVAASPAACFAARLFRGERVYVYRTLRACSAVRPRGVWDAELTGERWLIPPVALECVACVLPESASRACSGTATRVSRDGHATVETRLFSYFEAVVALGDELCEPGERRVVCEAVRWWQERHQV